MSYVSTFCLLARSAPTLEIQSDLLPGKFQIGISAKASASLAAATEAYLKKQKTGSRRHLMHDSENTSTDFRTFLHPFSHLPPRVSA
jgi:hypothetical protein